MRTQDLKILSKIIWTDLAKITVDGIDRTTYLFSADHNPTLLKR